MTWAQPWQVHPICTQASCAYLLAGPHGLVLVDAGLARDGAAVLQALRRLGRQDVRLIFITHAHGDHYGGAAAVRRATGAPIAIHQADAAALAQGRTLLGVARGRGRWLAGWVQRWRLPPLTPDILLRGGERLDDVGLDAEVLPTPGHTPGSISLWVAGQWLFVGDLLSSTGRPHAQRYFAADWAALAASVSQVQALRPQLTYPGHGRQPIYARELQAL